MLSFVRWSIALLALAAMGCAHARPGSSVFVHGRPGPYEVRLPAQAKESTEDFVRRVRRLQAEARPAKPATVALAIEANDPRLRARLAALANEPGAGSHRLVAREYLRLGVRDLAADHYSAAIALDRRDASSYEMLARIWRDWGFPGVGLGDAYRAVAHAPRSAAARNTLGTLFHRMGRYPEARNSYLRALILDPAASYALVNLCSLDLAEGQAQAAVASCGRAVAADAGSALARSSFERAQAAAEAVAAGERHEQQ